MAKALFGYLDSPRRVGRPPSWQAGPDEVLSREAVRLRRRIQELEAELGREGIEHTDPPEEGASETAPAERPLAEVAAFAGKDVLDHIKDDELISTDA